MTKLINVFFIGFIFFYSCNKGKGKNYSVQNLKNLSVRNDTIEVRKLLKKIEVFYKDSLSNKNRYRPLEYIGDDSYFSKPTKIDVELTLYDKHFDGVIDISIEELFVPNYTFTNSIYGDMKIKKSTWCLNKTLYHVDFKYKMSEKLKSKTIKIKNIDYNTAYYTDSFLYNKKGFRIIALYKFDIDDENFIEIVKKEYIINM